MGVDEGSRISSPYWISIAAVLLLFNAGTGGGATGSEGSRLFVDSRGGLVELRQGSFSNRVTAAPVESGHHPSPGHYKDVQRIGSTVYLLTNEGRLEQQLYANGKLSPEEPAKLIATEVQSFAVSGHHGLIFYITRDHVRSVVVGGGGSGSARWRLCVKGIDLQFGRTLLGDGSAPMATEMAVDSAKGLLFLLSKSEIGGGVLTRMRLDGAEPARMKFTLLSPEARLSSLTVCHVKDRFAVFWLEANASASRISRSVYTLKASKFSTLQQSGRLEVMWPSSQGIQVLTSSNGSSSAGGSVLTVPNTRLKEDTAREGYPAKLSDATASRRPSTPSPCTCASHKICVPVPRSDGERLRSRCLLPTFAGQRGLPVKGLGHVLLASTAHEIVAMFPGQVDARNITIVERLIDSPRRLYGLALNVSVPSRPGLYWSGHDHNAAAVISYTDLRDGATHTFEQRGVNRVEGLVFDPVSKVVLWNDRHQLIEAKSGDGSVRVNVLRQLKSAHGLAVDSNSGMMYWVEGSISAGSRHIMQAYLDGSGVRMLHSGNVSRLPLAIDTSVNPPALYWTESSNTTSAILRTMRVTRELDVVERPVFLTPLPIIPVAMTVGRDFLYLSHPTGVFRITKATGQWSSLIGVRNIPDVNTLAVLDFHEPGKNNTHCGGKMLCSNGLCLPSSNAGKMCHCPPGKTVEEVSGMRAQTCTGMPNQLLLAGEESLLELDHGRIGSVRSTAGRLPPCPHHHKHDCYLFAVDSLKHHIYTAIRGGQAIYRQSRSDNLAEPSELVQVIRTGSDRLSSIGGLAFDSQSSNLFWTDTRSQRVEVAHVDGSSLEVLHRTVLIWRDLLHPRHIELDPLAGVLYISSYNTEDNESSILRASMHGRIIDTVVTLENSTVVHSMTLHKPSGSLLYTDGAEIRRIDISASVPRETDGRLFSVVDGGLKGTCAHLASARWHLFFTTRGKNSTLYKARIEYQSGQWMWLDKPSSLSAIPVSSPVAVLGDPPKGDEMGWCTHSWLCGGLCLPRLQLYGESASAAIATANRPTSQLADSRHPDCFCSLGSVVSASDPDRHRCKVQPISDKPTLNGNEDILLVTKQDGSLYRVGGGDGSSDDISSYVMPLDDVSPLGVRLPHYGLRSVQYEESSDKLFWLNAEHSDIRSVELGRDRVKLFKKLQGPDEDVPVLRQIALNPANGYLYVVGGEEYLQVVKTNGTTLGRIVNDGQQPLMLAADEKTGLIFWVENADKVDVIMWGASFGFPKYSAFLHLHGHNHVKMTALTTSDHRMIFAERTENTIRACVFTHYIVDTSDTRNQPKCNEADVVVLQEGVGLVHSLTVSGDTLYYTNESGVWAIELPHHTDMELMEAPLRMKPARHIASGSDILSAVLYRRRASPTQALVKRDSCQANNSCQWFCQANSDSYVCGCPVGRVLRDDQHSCLDTGCHLHESYCKYGRLGSGGMIQGNGAISPEKCILFTYLCDSFCDCAQDCSDEIDCNCPNEGDIHCPQPDHYQCFKPIERCNGFNDCPISGYDEKNCTISCPKRGEMQCLSNGARQPMCLTRAMLCDGKKDCDASVYSDEDASICNHTDSVVVTAPPLPVTNYNNVITGVTLVFVLLVGILVLLYIHKVRSGRQQGKEIRGASQNSMGKTIHPDNALSDTSSPTGSVSDESAMSPSSHTIGQTSSSGTALTTMTEGTLVHDVSYASVLSAPPNTLRLRGGSRNGKSPTTSDESQKDSAFDGGTPCDHVDTSSESEYVPESPSDEFSITEGPEDRAMPMPPVDLDPSALDDLFSITTVEVNKVPTEAKALPPHITLNSDPRRLAGPAQSRGHHPTMGGVVPMGCIPPTHTPSALSHDGTHTNMGLSGPRRPAMPHHQPYGAGFPATISEYPNEYPVPIDDCDHNLQVFPGIASENCSVVGGGSRAGGPCPSEASQAVSFAGMIRAPCPSEASAYEPSVVSSAELGHSCGSGSCNCSSHVGSGGDTTSHSHYSGKVSYPTPADRLAPGPGPNHLKQSSGMPAAYNSSRRVGDSVSRVIQYDVMSTATGDGSVVAPPAPCSTPATRSTVGTQEQLGETS